MYRALFIAFLLLVCLAGAVPHLLMAPYEWLPEGEPVELWAVAEGERDACEGWDYRWDITMPEGVSREVVRGYVETRYGDYLLDERAFSLTGKVNDGWAIFTRQSFRNDTGASPVRIQATLTLTAPDGRTVTASRVYELGENANDSAEQAMEKRRKFAMLSGLHWLQRRQRPKGGWPCEIYSPASYWGDLFDYKAIDEIPDWEGVFDGEELLDVVEVTRDSEYYDNYLSMVASACALWAYGNCGYGLDNTVDNPFLGTVRAGLSHLGSRCSTLLLAGLQEMGLDTNRNGRGAALGEDENYRGYVQPMVIASLMAVCTPNAEIALPEGNVTAKDLVQDAFDYLGWCLFHYGKSAWPYNYRREEGFDLSIAGWNILALEALPNWGITVPASIKTEVLRLLYKNEDIAEGGFGYSSPDGSKTIALTAAAIMGLSLASNVDLSKDASHLCPQESRTAGELYLNAMRHLPSIIKEQGAFLDTGYFQWTLIRMLQSEKIRTIVAGDDIIDWRYDHVEQGGLWDRILSLQMYDGHWMFLEENFAYGYYNDELETAYMLLSLSNELVRRTSVISDLNVVARVPLAVGEGLVQTDFAGMEYADDEARFSYYLAQWDQASPLTLSMDYVLPEGEAGDELVLKGVEATYVNVLGEPEGVEDGAQYVSRTGEVFSLELLAPPEAVLGENVPIVASVGLPNGDGFKMATLSLGNGECVLEYDVPVKWTTLQLYPEDALLPEIGYKPNLNSAKWIAPGTSHEDGRVRLHNAQGRVLRLAYAGNGDVKALVYHVSAEYSLLLEVEGTALASQPMDEEAFGSTHEMQRYWNTAGMAAGSYGVRAVLLKNGEALLERKTDIKLLGREDYELQGLIGTSSDVYLQGEDVGITSTVMRIGGDSTLDQAEVSLSIASDEAEVMLGEWAIANLGEASFWQKGFALRAASPGTYVVGQSVASQDGRAWYASTEYSVVATAEIEPDPEDGPGGEEQEPKEEKDDEQTGEEDDLGEEGTDEDGDAGGGQDKQGDGAEDDGVSGDAETDGTGEDGAGDGESDGDNAEKGRRRRRRGGGGIGSSSDNEAEENEQDNSSRIVNYLGGGTRVITAGRETVQAAKEKVAAGGGAAIMPIRTGRINDIAAIEQNEDKKETQNMKKAEKIVEHDKKGMIEMSVHSEYMIKSLEKLRLAGLWNLYGDGCCIYAGKASVADEYKEVPVYKSWHNILERHRRLLPRLEDKAIHCEGNLTVDKGWLLKSGIYHVKGDVRIYGKAAGPVTLVCDGKVILRGSGTFEPCKENVLVLARKGVFVLGEGTTYKGELCSLESEVRILGDRLVFMKGGIFGRRIGVYGSNNAFLPIHDPADELCF
ncbi:MAG: hypothetical protein J5746_08540 [Victivallales bacterium]|nr:hypothetical protein [Victivallales bacterium]